MTERKHAELLNQVREMLVWRKWSTGQVSENKTLLEDSLEQLTVSQTLAKKRYDGYMLVHTCMVHVGGLRNGNTVKRQGSRWCIVFALIEACVWIFFGSFLDLF